MSFLSAADVDRLRRYATRRPAQSREAAEAEVQAETERIWREREAAELRRDPTFAQIPRFHLKRSHAPRTSAHRGGGGGGARAGAASSADDQRRALEEGVGKLARRRLREHMLSLMLEPAELDECWRLLRAHASPPASPLDERIDYAGFCRVADAMPARLGRHFFGAEHFLRFPNDPYGRVSIVHYFCWLRSKTAILRTRIEFSLYDHYTDGTLGERELEQWVSDLLPQLPALRELREEFFPFYKVTAVRKFFFFLDPRRRGRISLQKMLSSPIMQELLELRRGDLGQEELRQNWFSLEYAEMLYSDYLELDADQNGMLSVGELMRFRGGAPPGGGLTAPFVQRVFQEGPPHTALASRSPLGVLVGDLDLIST